MKIELRHNRVAQGADHFVYTMKRQSVPTYIQRSVYRAAHWETWHWLIKYIPMVPFWIMHCLRAKSPWFFTAANPTLTFGGYAGESKMEMYSLLPAHTYPNSFLISPAKSELEVELLFKSTNLTFPVAAKPDVGRMGLMFRKLNSLEELFSYHRQMKVDYILQEFVDLPLEVSVFYYRFPNQEKGTITGFVKKERLSVTGDGVSTLHDLMLNYSRVQFRLEEMQVKHAPMLHSVIALGEIYVLSEALNLSRGGQLISLESEKDERLLELFDGLSHAGKFYFGRYDIKCSSIDDIKKGRNYSILEFNGTGAEPHHVYGNNNSILQAIDILLAHWKILYRISVENNKRGIDYWSLRRGLRHIQRANKHIQILKKLEYSTVLPTKTEIKKSYEKDLVLRHYELT
jgi:hypothetical protein